MERRSRFLTFVLALIPGVGQMYLGLVKKGIQLFLLFILIDHVLGFVGLGYIGGMLKLCVWAYAFWDTFEIARRLDRGEKVNDSDYIFNKYMDKRENEEAPFSYKGHSFNKSFWLLCGWGLIVIGILAIVNLSFGNNDIYGQIKSAISTYFIPGLLVIAGIYMLIINRKK